MIRLDKREDLTVDQLRSHFHYNPNTGIFRRTIAYIPRGGSQPCNKIITSKNNRGYYWLRFFDKVFLVHRLVHLYVTGQHPQGEIDHINGDRLDNRWCNLRDVNTFENSRNQGIRKDCTSGCRGVTFRSGEKYGGKDKWVVRISHKGIRYSLGYFMKFDDAVKARRDAEIEFGYHHNHAKRMSHR